MGYIDIYVSIYNCIYICIYIYMLWAKRLTVSVWSAHSVICVIRAVHVLAFPISSLKDVRSEVAWRL